MTDGKNIFKILDDMIAHNGQDYPIYANEVLALQIARDALAERDRKLEHIEDVAKDMCEHYCKYPRHLRLRGRRHRLIGIGILYELPSEQTGGMK